MNGIDMQKKIFVLFGFFFSCIAALAEQSTTSQPLVAFNNAKVLIESKFSTCTTESRTDIAKIGYAAATKESKVEISADQCIKEGKESVKKAFTDIQTKLGTRKAPAELADWRMEWTTAFDAARTQNTDTEASYIRRINEVKQKALRASTKLEIALE